MSILRNFEKHLEGAVEGTFAKTFRSGLQPVELAKRLVRDMAAGRSVGVDGRTVAPNRYVFTLSHADMDRFEAAQGTLIAELGQVVRSNAEENGWTLIGPPEIRFRTDDRLTKGLFRCEATLAQGVDPGPAAAVTTPAAPSEPAAASRRHAQITHAAGEFRLTDLGSTNGTTVGGSPVGEHVLVPGEIIQIGQTTFEFGRG